MKTIVFVLFVVFMTACRNGYVRNDDVTIASIDNAVNIESAGWVPPRTYMINMLLTAMNEQSQERLPFDEPKTEHGQEDGKLRDRWHNAYVRKRPFYYFNGDKYPTFAMGKPFVPQVCADFIVDSIDRTAGTWYKRDRHHPGRTHGRIDLRSQIRSSGHNPRSITSLVEFFRENPADFEFVFEGHSARIGRLNSFRLFLREQGTQVGDIIFIHGPVPWDDEEEHSHSFFVTGFNEKGLVEFVTGNPVYPVERHLVVESRRSPLRYATHIIRLSGTFLRKISGL